MKTGIIALTKSGNILAEKIASALNDCIVFEKGKVFDRIQTAWEEVDGIICIMAAGIVVRSLASLCRDKKVDPCVIVVDEKGDFVVSLLSGHIGGGNDLARKVAGITGGTAVITTASDVSGHTALDLWMAENRLTAANPKKLTSASALLVNEGTLSVYSEVNLAGLPKDFFQIEKKEDADIVISPLFPEEYKLLWLIPRNLYVGFGCNRGTTMAEFEQALNEICQKHRIDERAVAGLASIDLKKDEEGLLDFAEKKQLQISFFSKNELNTIEGITPSKAAFKATGAKGVAEPAAILAANSAQGPGSLLLRKMKWKNVTAAVAVKKIQFKE
jgi:cobalt-precorrin 5A hydrolase